MAKELSLGEVIDLMLKIRAGGYAVAVFTPEEMGDLAPEDIEDVMITSGNNYIDMNKERDGQ